MLVGIFPNLSKKNIEHHVNDLCKHLKNADIDFYIIDSYREEAQQREYHFTDNRWASLQEMQDSMDMAFTLGGDGTLISVAKLLLPYDIPLCGVNLGELGFLNMIEPDELDTRLEQIKAGDYKIWHRSLLASAILHESGQVQQLPAAMNEVVIGRSRPGRMARLRLYVNDVFVEEYPADGIIVSTATGSTGYALSCGGPIMHPNLSNMMVIPICPHLLKSSPLMLNADDEVTITMPERERHLYASIDGNESFYFTNEKKLLITRHPNSLPFVYFSNQNFFRLLFPKLTKSIYHAAQ